MDYKNFHIRNPCFFFIFLQCPWPQNDLGTRARRLVYRQKQKSAMERGIATGLGRLGGNIYRKPIGFTMKSIGFTMKSIGSDLKWCLGWTFSTENDGKNRKITGNTQTLMVITCPKLAARWFGYRMDPMDPGNHHLETRMTSRFSRWWVMIFHVLLVKIVPWRCLFPIGDV